MESIIAIYSLSKGKARPHFDKVAVTVFMAVVSCFENGAYTGTITFNES